MPSTLVARLVVLGWLLGLLFGGTSCTMIRADDRLVVGEQKLELSRSEGNCDRIAEPAHVFPDGSTEGFMPGSEVSVLSWNVLKGARAGWQEDLQTFGKASDLVLLQEAPLDRELLQFFENQHLFWHYNSAFKYKGVETGVVAASSIHSLESCGTRQNEPIIGLPKTTLLTTYAINGSPQTLLVANMHSVNFSLGIAAYKTQLDSLREMLERHDGPLLVVGDFNNWNEKRTLLINGFARDLSLSHLNFKEGGRTRIFGKPVDHIFYRGVEPVSARVYQVRSSDHNPILVTFRIAEPGGKQGGNSW